MRAGGWFVAYLPDGDPATRFPDSLSVQLPSSPSLPVQLPPSAASFDKNCAPWQAPVADHGRSDRNSYDQPHEVRKGRGYG